MALTAMGFLWCGSQIPLYLFGGCIAIIYGGKCTTGNDEPGASFRHRWSSPAERMS